MTSTLDELEQIPVLDDSDHWICEECNPGYVPGKMVTAICGDITEDCPPGSNDLSCELCEDIEFCPVCRSYVR